MKRLLTFLAVAAILFAPVANASIYNPPPSTSVSPTSTINGVTGPTFTVSIVSTSSASSVTTSSAQLFLNLLQYTSSSDITITSTGTITFASHNISQFTNNSGYGTSNVSTSSANTWSQPQTFNGISNTGNVTSTSATVSGAVTAGAYSATASTTISNIANIDSYQYASSTLPTGFAEYNAYLNSLCATNASGTTIYTPNGSFNVSSTLNATNRCAYKAVGGNGTILNWTGAQGGTMVNENWGVGIQGNGGGLSGFTLNCNSATTTNPTIGLLQGGNAGARTANNDNDTIVNCGVGYKTTNNTYMSILSNSTLSGNGITILIATSSVSGESMNFSNVYAVEPGNSSSSRCFFVGSSGLENGVWNGGSLDDCGAYFMGGNNFTFIGVNCENPGYATYGRFECIQEVSSFYDSNINWLGGNFQNDDATTSTAPADYVDAGGNFYSWGVQLGKGSSGDALPASYVVNTFSTVNGVATVCQTLNQDDGTYGVTSIFPAGNTSNITNNGCLSLVQNNYVQGVDYTSSATNFYQNGGLAAQIINSTKGWLDYGPTGYATTAVSTTNASNITGSDNTGYFTINHASVTTSTLTFAPAWVNGAPVCGAEVSSGTPVAFAATSSLTTVTFTAASSLANTTAINYWCTGNPN